jgi:hypothetical protein
MANEPIITRHPRYVPKDKDQRPADPMIVSVCMGRLAAESTSAELTIVIGRLEQIQRLDWKNKTEDFGKFRKAKLELLREAREAIHDALSAPAQG